jgi:hypothetical protein
MSILTFASFRVSTARHAAGCFLNLSVERVIDVELSSPA